MYRVPLAKGRFPPITFTNTPQRNSLNYSQPKNLAEAAPVGGGVDA